MTEKAELNVNGDAELSAMAIVFNALQPLDSDARNRVIEYVERRLGMQRSSTPAPYKSEHFQHVPPEIERGDLSAENDHAEHSFDRGDQDNAGDDEIEGISPIAKKWMMRNALSPALISKLYSLGVDEFDLVAPNVPGKSVRERLHNVILLQGVASYLNSGAPRVDGEKLREAVDHYDADAGRNFAAYVKDWTSEFSGSRTSGFTLTTRGLNSAKELIKQMAGSVVDND